MSPASNIENILKEMKQSEEIDDATLVSRSGMHIAGEVPEGAHKETYVAMSAILLGSSETATSELDDELRHVLVELKNSRILIQDGGPSAILVTRLKPDGDVEKVLEDTEQAIKDLKELL